MQKMSLADRIALILSLLGILAGYIVSDRVFERMAHLEDEMAYVWEAKAIAGGHITVPSPPEPKSFLIPFVIDHNGQRFGKYPLGWPVLLSFGERIGVPYLVNPLLAGLAIWLIYRLGKMVFGEVVGGISALLTLTSPFFLMNSGSLLSHPFGLVLSTAFAIAWVDAFWKHISKSRWLPTIVAALTLGVLIITRPFTALAIAIPFGIAGLYLLIRGDKETRLRLIVIGAVLLVFVGLHFLWQYAVTGDPLLNPYTLWWDYDRVGFGPGHGRDPVEGHTLKQAWINTKFSLKVGRYDLFGWWSLSWIFLPFGLIAVIKDRNWVGLFLGTTIVSLVVVYLAYWIGASLFGPRYFYEGLYSLVLLSGVGIAFLAGWPTLPGQRCGEHAGINRIRGLAMAAVLTFLIGWNLLFYVPLRVGGMHGLYGVERKHIEPFLTKEAQELTPALVIVHTKDKWIEYGTLLDLEDPYLSTPFIFVIARGPRTDARVAKAFPDRAIFHYYPDEPYRFYTAPRPK